MGRIADTFARLRAEGRAALMPYLMSGYPTRGALLDLVPALEAAGADLFEIGIPFSDPLADGATIQRAAERALANGQRLPDTIAEIARLRAAGVRAPLVLMGYVNPFLQYGIDRLLADAAAAGVDGLIIPDLPPEEAGEIQRASAAHGLDLIMFVAPTTPDERISEIAALASGFIYCVSLTGVTGARRSLWSGLPEFLGRVRARSSVPLVVGFGISTAGHVAEVARHAEGAIVASALISAIDQSPDDAVATAVAFVRGLAPGTAVV
jgi:tryptophan synthase alpha chain